LKRRVGEISSRWGKLRLSGDVRFRYEGFFNQGFDAEADEDARNRLRLRVRAQLSGEINEHFDWGVRVASGSFTEPVATNQTLTQFYNRKPIALDRAFIHFDSGSDADASSPARLELVAGKFDYPWKRTSATFDGDLQPEGLAEKVAFPVSREAALRRVTLVAWQLPFKERSIGADAFILGGQVLTDWQLSDNLSLSLAGAFHDFEQVDLIPPALGVSPTLVNAGLEYGTTNALMIDPGTHTLQFRSEFRVVDTLVELGYAGLGERWPLLVRANWIRNTSAFNNQKDGGMAQVHLGRKSAAGDCFAGWDYLRLERESFPSVFVDADLQQTNSNAHRLMFGYTLQPKIGFDFQYILHRKLESTAIDSRWLNRVQFDVTYRF
jgi:hypothetical protein